MEGTTEIHKVIILGSGPCGLTAALYTARAGLKPLVLEGEIPGGQLTTTTVIENFPGAFDPSKPEGEEKGLDGTALIETMKQQAAHFGATYKIATVDSFETTTTPFKIKLKGTDGFLQCHSLIVATGARARLLNIPSETKYWSQGVTSCATCDGYFYRGREVCVIGGGDSACEEATFLTRFCPKVYIIHRREEFRASKIMADRVLNHPKITMVWNSTVDEILGDDTKSGIQVTGVKLKSTKTGEITEMAIGGVFLAIGHIPNTDFLKGVSKLDENGYAITEPDSTKTELPGLFIAGDAKDHVYRQAITAAGSGCMAAIESERWLESQNH
eukprot:TRINITY_DN3818_c0_g1_i1.p1 TRINITY_DN3818_c0_g1~~TRINITY_DN3818_c0_g1_i1.p1  ORF type:complete len:368 (+),score=99.69 TRINITY_DN3818_c0_g1_i1:118-1104(+)